MALRELGIAAGGAGLGALLYHHCAAPPPSAAEDAAAAAVGTQLPTMRRKVHGDAIYLDWNATSPIFPEVRCVRIAGH